MLSQCFGSGVSSEKKAEGNYIGSYKMKAINGDSQCTEVMVPMAHSERSPVLLFMGGGMGAGKSTVVKDILKESFWSGAASNAVVVEQMLLRE
ncbi:hypothetical protein JHK84_056869 [Glycine max]|nr:hypothetical protein JHK84_056869 [Glycine max]